MRRDRRGNITGRYIDRKIYNTKTKKYSRKTKINRQEERQIDLETDRHKYNTYRHKYIQTYLQNYRHKEKKRRRIKYNERLRNEQS